MIAKTRNQATSGVPLYQLKITLKWSKPPIWRRVLVRADLDLDRLHHVIQIAMGWTNSHLHQFAVGRTFYGQPNPEVGGFSDEMLNEKRYTVTDIAPAAKSKFIYDYDFGDSWAHEVVVEKILPADSGFKHPVCLGGAKACPPEDCGGVPGYYNLLETLADPKHPEHDDMMAWIDGEWDAARFDLDEVNADLKKLRA